MTPLDWTVVGLYFAALISLSYWWGRRQADERDYYLGGQTMSWRTIGLSTMATQLGAISFISAPAFVGLREDGGLKWLGYEFGVPLAMIFLIAFVIPPLYRAGVVSIYEYLERRFGGTTRVLVSLAFQISRALATGVGIYAMALVLSAALGVPVTATILITGGVTIVYDMLGGMKAVVYSDVIQMAVIGLGILLTSLVALDLLGGWQTFLANVQTERLHAVDFAGVGLGDGSEFGFWPLVIGGFFLYASYYGTDQVQAQRLLACRSLRDARFSLLFNGIARFPLVVLYCFMGLFLGTFALVDADFRALLPLDNPDLAVPTFIIHYLPAGLTGLLIVGILAAAMSSLDSALNSLSAASMRDLVVRHARRPLTERESLRWSRSLTLFWGVFCSGMAFLVGNISATVIEAINLLGSLFYGPILAVFTLAFLSRRTHGTAAAAGLVAGVALNLGLWVFAGDRVFWFWWNATGFAATVLVALGWSLLRPRPYEALGTRPAPIGSLRRKEVPVLILYFLGIVAFSLGLSTLLRSA